MTTFVLLTFITIFSLLFSNLYLFFKKREGFSDKDNSSYKTLIDKSPDNIILLNRAGYIVYVNETSEKTGGYPNDEIKGKHISKAGFFHTEDIPKYLGIIKRVLTGEEVGFIEVDYISYWGEERVSQVSMALVSLPSGFSGIQIVWRDITEEKLKDQRLAELNEALKILNKILRHDILNDITVILGGVEMYKTYKDQDIEDLISDINNSAMRSKDLISQMKDLESAITSGSDLTPVEAAKEIKKSAITFEDLKISIKGNATVMADSAFPAIFSNFFRNAIMHGEATKIEIEISENAKEAEITIADNGNGIPDSIKPKLFNEGAKFGETGNTGLGLYIIRKTIQRYGGEVSVTDNKPKGAKFVIKLPK